MYNFIFDLFIKLLTQSWNWNLTYSQGEKMQQIGFDACNGIEYLSLVGQQYMEQGPIQNQYKSSI